MKKDLKEEEDEKRVIGIDWVGKVTKVRVRGTPTLSETNTTSASATVTEVLFELIVTFPPLRIELFIHTLEGWSAGVDCGKTREVDITVKISFTSFGERDRGKV